MEDSELIRRVLAGEHEQFSLLVQRHQEPLIHFLQRLLGPEEEVFDCAQEAFLAAYRNLWRYSEAYSFRAWLYAIAKNKATDLRRKRRREMPSLIDDSIADREAGPEDRWLAKEEAEGLAGVLEKLPDSYRQALYLRYKQELSYEEIAQVLCVPVSRVKTYLHRGKQKLRREMERGSHDARGKRFLDPGISG
ncbi:RNA polymerase sigma factor, sigma-70 family [Acididesulfobacillus acetoxydans]|uniref:RNA polymerase sigma factor, sigma-70 family n=1 Tax=Acididesulfobacillus acetoxydans TaxID=1561005 RepID=A0A8S0WEK0_9FIRM|nr:sigma-70 family RNA polymerase sigma factor [Acididesulfobacillus acetoxydans]CAA7600202.1 RNA polymerase sigma factor, sigma-70 family [Acididesulfobacillus acetoxydans]CEJ09580.1 RNA polymerase, sigma-24 subunit, ECF sub [Acididesulfobacillus acetoxydans]